MAGKFGPGNARAQRDLHRLGFGQPALDIGREEIVDQPLPFLRMWRTGNQRDHVRHHRDADAIRIRQHHRDGLFCLERHVDVIRVGETRERVAPRHHVADHRVAVDDLHVVRSKLAEEFVGPIIADLCVQRRDVKRCRAESWIGDGHLALPARVGQVENGTRGVGVCHLVGVVDDHAQPRREAGPVAVAILEGRADLL